jgi:phosphoheptose isomerase
MQQKVHKQFDESARVVATVRQDTTLQQRLGGAAEACIGVLRAGGKLMLARNAGSAADAQYIAGDVPTADTPKIQEGHLLLGHTLCGLIEQARFPRGA